MGQLRLVRQHGQMMPDDWKQQLEASTRSTSAPSAGDGGRQRLLWGSLLKFGREFDQYINLRPVRLFRRALVPWRAAKAGATSTTS
ncbi:MAG: hypothetical protein IPG91_11395 [Ideonella sp.]|nr:hypothetical protein [Ideonella sp.]